MKKILIYIVSYERKSYTIGTINRLVNAIKFSNVQHQIDIIVCDNGSTDGTREWLKENQDIYRYGLLFPETNLRVGGAWKLLTKTFDRSKYDYVLLLDNDGWLVPTNLDWLNTSIKMMNLPNVGSLGLQREKNPGHFSYDKYRDVNYDNRTTFETIQYYDTVYYAAFRFDRFDLWHDVMSTWQHKYIGDKIGRTYNSLGFRTLKVTPGYIVDISEYNFDNDSHIQYNREFHERERDLQEFELRLEKHATNDANIEFITTTFGEEYLKYL